MQLFPGNSHSALGMTENSEYCFLKEILLWKHFDIQDLFSILATFKFQLAQL